MSNERYIHGSPHGNEHHDGLYSNVKRDQESADQLREAQDLLYGQPDLIAELEFDLFISEQYCDLLDPDTEGFQFHSQRIDYLRNLLYG